MIMRRNQIVYIGTGLSNTSPNQIEEVPPKYDEISMRSTDPLDVNVQSPPTYYGGFEI